MADNNKENRMSIDDFDFAHEDANDDTSMLVKYLVTWLHQAMGNPALQGKVQQQLHAYGILPPIQQERGSERFQGETSKRGLSTEKRVENPYQELKQLLEGKPSSKKKGHAQHMKGSGYSSQERQRRGHRSSYAIWKRSSKLKKFKEGGKNISFLTYDCTFGATDKVLAFIQQFDPAFGDEGFTESSKLCHVAMHFQKSARQWWASLQANGEAPKTWKALRASIMKQFLASDAKDKVLIEWRSLKLSPYESIHKYVDKFWDLHLKATVYKKIDFEEQKQQFCAGLPEDMNEYVNFQRRRSISAVIHHTMVATRIDFQQGAKRKLKPMEAKDKQEFKGKIFSQNYSKDHSNNNSNKAKEKGEFKGKNKLSPKELANYRKENKKDMYIDVNKAWTCYNKGFDKVRGLACWHGLRRLSRQKKFAKSPGLPKGSNTIMHLELASLESDSKVCNMLTMQEFCCHYHEKTRVVFSSLYLGCIATTGLLQSHIPIFRTLFPPFRRTLQKVLCQKKSQEKGLHRSFENVLLEEASSQDKANKVWEASKKLVGLA
ncbi:hypothetical protein L7F22_023149 [Adiantum nelumboides]|nr:hypothetical protein [Adiantum nelumboides]